MTHRSLRESTVRPTRALGPNRLGRRGLPPMAALLLTLLAAGCGGGADVDMTPDASTNEPEPPPPAKPTDVDEIGRDPADVPSPVGDRAPQHLTIDITAREVIAEMSHGTTYGYWTFDGTVPGPMLRGRVGDTVTVTLTNARGNSMNHDIDFHAVTGPGGGAPLLTVRPGQSRSGSFELLHPGVFIYHCASTDPPLHIAHGMYGLIVVEPEGGLPPVDHEYYVVQGDFYSAYDATDLGHQTYDDARALREDPTFVVFNGRVGSLTSAGRQLEARTGETIRIFVGNAGPNLVSSFHIIGEMFDRVWEYGAISDDNPPLRSVQTVLIPAGGAAMVELTAEGPGDYLLVDHSLFRVHKGAEGLLHVTGDPRPDIYAPAN